MTFFQLRQQAWNVGGVVLAVCIHENDHVTRRCPGATFDGCAVTLAVGVVNNNSSRCFGHFCSIVGGAIVDHDYFSIGVMRSEEHTSELQSRENLVCRLLLEKK